MSKGFQKSTKLLLGARKSPAPPPSNQSATPQAGGSPRKLNAKLSIFKKAGNRTLANARVRKTKSNIIRMERARAVEQRMKANRLALLQRCYAALRKRPKDRTEKEIMMLVDFTTTNKFFKDKFEHVGDPYHREVCRRMQHRVCRADEYIIRQGEVGDEFYIIMKGKVRVQLEPEEEGGEAKTLVTLGPGDSFGELALINENPRAASCVLSSISGELVVIRKNDFREILEKSHVSTLNSRAKWLRMVPLFRSLDSKKLLVVASHMSLRSYSRHEIIIKEGTHAGSMFLLVKGRCRVFKTDDNRLLELSGLAPGQIFGELGILLPGSSRTASVIAEDVQVKALELASFDFFNHLGHLQDTLLDDCFTMYPSEVEIGDRLKNHKKWEHYKRSLIGRLQEDRKRSNMLKNKLSLPGQPHPACLRGTPSLRNSKMEPTPPIYLLRSNGLAAKQIASMRQEQLNAMPWKRKKLFCEGLDESELNSMRERQKYLANERRMSQVEEVELEGILRLTRQANIQKHGVNSSTLNSSEDGYTHTLKHHAEQRFQRRLSLRGTGKTFKVPIIAGRTISACLSIVK